ncbi:hypothetical protein M9M90_09735 [Phenylobacterium sp. LH3H17]|uniref:hypothetical protein n=1 Tax=Phenylobacterium sp. LH3H17 TaxID=2903901 RepID=UPI0020C9CDB9|nr:hypothetical protein [Phenylobacterium sp. LH3H17]UTP41433.1 hypothetical protein M9M90_09735 [Phenylobacterium sp. LH3H17]
MTRASATAREGAEALSDRLNARLDELALAGRSALKIDASIEDIARLFVELGEDAILMDCDPKRDVAWYRDCELRASAVPGVRVVADDGRDPSRFEV